MCFHDHLNRTPLLIQSAWINYPSGLSVSTRIKDGAKPPSHALKNQLKSKLSWGVGLFRSSGPILIELNGPFCFCLPCQQRDHISYIIGFRCLCFVCCPVHTAGSPCNSQIRKWCERMPNKTSLNPITNQKTHYERATGKTGDIPFVV